MAPDRDKGNIRRSWVVVPGESSVELQPLYRFIKIYQAKLRCIPRA